MIDKGLLITGIILLVLFYIPVKTGGVWNIGNKTGLVIGAMLYALGMFYQSITHGLFVLWQYPQAKALILLTGGCLLLIVAIALAETVLMIVATCRKPGESGTLIVLGCKLYEDKPSRTLKGRLDAALSYMEQHDDVVCIVSGGQGDDEPISEAESMYRYLTEKGLAPERIFREDQSRSTRENLMYSKEIIRQNLLDSAIIIVTSEFHQYRASLLAKKMYPSYSALSGQTPWWLLPTFYIRELYGILYQQLQSLRSGSK